MNQKPSQFRLVLSWSHAVASRISRLAVRGCRAMSAMTKSLDTSDAVVTGARGRIFRHLGRAGGPTVVPRPRPIVLLAIDALQLPLALRHRGLGILGAGAVIGEHVD